MVPDSIAVLIVIPRILTALLPPTVFLPASMLCPTSGPPTPAHASPDAVPSNGDHTSPSRSAEWQLIAVSAKPTVDEPMLDPLSQLPPYQEPQYWP